MAFMGCYTNDQRVAIEARAEKIMKGLKVQGSCDCGAAELGHAPDCGGVLNEDAAWDYAVDRAASELGF